MLRIVRHLGKLPFGSLMEVYREGNEENGLDCWPEASPERRLAMAEERFYQYLREVFFTTPGAAYALWEVEGRPVSALRLEPYRDGLLIEAVETLPALRLRGYAKQLLLAVLEQYRGNKLYSHVGKLNEPSLGLHQSCGFQRVLEYAVYIDGSVNSRCCTMVWNG